MRSGLLLPIWAGIAFVLYKITLSLALRIRNARAAKRLHCKPVPTFPLPGYDLLGITNVAQIIQANNAGRLPNYVAERVDIVAKQEDKTVLTFQTQIFQAWLYFTVDPKNVQAILATQFKEFELGPIRYGTFSPL
jgi:hypothetical protein